MNISMLDIVNDLAILIGKIGVGKFLALIGNNH